jgi:hypothetical protein
MTEKRVVEQTALSTTLNSKLRKQCVRRLNSQKEWVEAA